MSQLQRREKYYWKTTLLRFCPLPLPAPDDWLDARSVRDDSAQSLSEAEKLRARTNIGTRAGSHMFVSVNSVGKVAGFVSAIGVIPFVDQQVGVIVFAAASILKDAVNRIGDLLDDGQPNQSFKG